MSMFRARANPTPYPHPPAHHHAPWRCVTGHDVLSLHAVLRWWPLHCACRARDRQQHPDADTSGNEHQTLRRARGHAHIVRAYARTHRRTAQRRLARAPEGGPTQGYDGVSMGRSLPSRPPQALSVQHPHPNDTWCCLSVIDSTTAQHVVTLSIDYWARVKGRSAGDGNRRGRMNRSVRPGIGILSTRTRWVASLWRAAGMEHTSSAGVAAT